MFEGKLTSVLNKLLGEYVHGISAKDLSVAVFKGDVVLKNLRLKTEALNALDLPFAVRSGLVGKLSLQIPWRALGKQPVVATIERLYVVAGFADDVDGTDALTVEERTERWERAKAELRRRVVDEGESKWLESAAAADGTNDAAMDKQQEDAAKGGDGWLAGMLDTVLGNLEVNISKIHVRLEGDLAAAAKDDASNISADCFAAGVTLESLTVNTVDASGTAAFSVGGLAERMRKSAKLARLAVYFDVGAASVKPAGSDRWENVSPDDLVAAMEPGVGSDTNTQATPEATVRIHNPNPVAIHQATTRQYLLKPVSAQAVYERRGKKEPRDDSKISAQRIHLRIDSVGATLTSSHLRAVYATAERIERDARRAPHAHIRPDVAVRSPGGAKVWWRFACSAVALRLEERRVAGGYVSRSSTFRIDKVVDTMRARRRYVDAYIDRALVNHPCPRKSSKKKASGDSGPRWPPRLTIGDVPVVDEVERTYPSHVCVLFRALAHQQARRRGVIKDADDVPENGGAIGFLRGMFGSSKNKSNGSESVLDVKGTDQSSESSDGEMSEDDWASLNRVFDLEGHVDAAFDATNSLSAANDNSFFDPLQTEASVRIGSVSLQLFDDEIKVKVGHDSSGSSPTYAPMKEVLHASLTGLIAGARTYASGGTDARLRMRAVHLDVGGSKILRAAGSRSVLFDDWKISDDVAGSVTARAVADALWDDDDDDDDRFEDADGIGSAGDGSDSEGGESAKPAEALSVRFEKLSKKLSRSDDADDDASRPRPDIRVGVVLAPAYVTLLRAPVEALTKTLSRHKPAQLAEQEELLKKAVAQSASDAARGAQERLVAALADRPIVDVSVTVHAPRVAVPSNRVASKDESRLRVNTGGDFDEYLSDDPATLLLDLGKFELRTVPATDLGASVQNANLFNAFRVKISDVSASLLSGPWDPNESWRAVDDNFRGFSEPPAPLLPPFGAEATALQALAPVHGHESMEIAFNAGALRVAVSPSRLRQLDAVAAQMKDSSQDSSQIDAEESLNAGGDPSDLIDQDDTASMTGSDIFSDAGSVDVANANGRVVAARVSVLKVSFGRLRWIPCFVRLDAQSNSLLLFDGKGKHVCPATALSGRGAGAMRFSKRAAAGQSNAICVCDGAVKMEEASAAMRAAEKLPETSRADSSIGVAAADHSSDRTASVAKASRIIRFRSEAQSTRWKDLINDAAARAGGNVGAADVAAGPADVAGSDSSARGGVEASGNQAGGGSTVKISATLTELSVVIAAPLSTVSADPSGLARANSLGSDVFYDADVDEWWSTSGGNAEVAGSIPGERALVRLVLSAVAVSAVLGANTKDVNVSLKSLEVHDAFMSDKLGKPCRVLASSAASRVLEGSEPSSSETRMWDQSSDGAALVVRLRSLTKESNEYAGVDTEVHAALGPLSVAVRRPSLAALAALPALMKRKVPNKDRNGEDLGNDESNDGLNQELNREGFDVHSPGEVVAVESGKSRVAMRVNARVDTLRLALLLDDADEPDFDEVSRSNGADFGKARVNPGCVAEARVSHLVANVSLYPSTLAAKFTLGSLTVCDPRLPATHPYRWAVSGGGGSNVGSSDSRTLPDSCPDASDSPPLVEVAYETFDPGAEHDGATASASARLRPTRVVFLNRFIAEGKAFVAGLTDAIAAIDKSEDASVNAGSVSKEIGSNDAASSPTRGTPVHAIRLDVALEAPTIVVPRATWDTSVALELDFGSLVAKNSLSKRVLPSGGGNEVVDRLNVGLSGVHVDVVRGDDAIGGGVTRTPLMRAPASVDAVVWRVLSAGRSPGDPSHSPTSAKVSSSEGGDSSIDVPDLAVDADIAPLRLDLSAEDYRLLTTCFTDNTDERPAAIPKTTNPVDSSRFFALNQSSKLKFDRSLDRSQPFTRRTSTYATTKSAFTDTGAALLTLEEDHLDGSLEDGGLAGLDGEGDEGEVVDQTNTLNRQTRNERGAAAIRAACAARGFTPDGPTRVASRISIAASVVELSLFRGGGRHEPLASLAVRGICAEISTLDGAPKTGTIHATVASLAIEDLRDGSRRVAVHGGYFEGGSNITGDSNPEPSRAPPVGLPLLTYTRTEGPAVNGTRACATLQRIRLEVEPTFILDVGRVFVPALAGGGGEAPGLVLPDDLILSPGEVYTLNGDTHLGKRRRILADGVDGGVYVLDGGGYAITVDDDVFDGAGATCDRPVIFVGPNCSLTLRNVVFETSLGNLTAANVSADSPLSGTGRGKAAWPYLVRIAPGGKVCADARDKVSFASSTGDRASRPALFEDNDKKIGDGPNPKASDPDKSNGKSNGLKPGERSSLLVRITGVELRLIGETRGDERDAVDLNFGLAASIHGETSGVASGKSLEGSDGRISDEEEEGITETDVQVQLLRVGVSVPSWNPRLGRWADGPRADGHVLAPVDLTFRKISTADAAGEPREDARMTVVSGPLRLALSSTRLALVLRVAQRLAAATAAQPARPCSVFVPVWSSSAGPESGNSKAKSKSNPRTTNDAGAFGDGISGVASGAASWAMWRPTPPAGYAPLGDLVSFGDKPPGEPALVIRDSPAFTAQPVGFEPVRIPQSAIRNGAVNGLALWRPVPPRGFVALGLVATVINSQTEVNSQTEETHPPPNADCVRCVRSELVCAAEGLRGRACAGIGDAPAWIADNCARTVVESATAPVWDLRSPTGLPGEFPENGDSNGGSATTSPATNSAVFDESQPATSASPSLRRTSGKIGSGAGGSTEPPPATMTVVEFTRVWWDHNSGAHSRLSVWRPVCPSGFVSVGDVAVSELQPPASTTVVRMRRPGDASSRSMNSRSMDPVAFPVDWECVWRDSGWRAQGKKAGTVSFWAPVPPDGYVSLGHVASASHAPPPLDACGCLRADLACVVPIESFLSGPAWTPSGAGFKLGRKPLAIYRASTSIDFLSSDTSGFDRTYLPTGTFHAVNGEERSERGKYVGGGLAPPDVAYGLPVTRWRQPSDTFSSGGGGSSSDVYGTVATVALDLLDATLHVDETSAPLARLSLRRVNLDARLAPSLSAELAASADVSHFNARTASWEPVIEPWDLAARYVAKKPYVSSNRVGSGSVEDSKNNSSFGVAGGDMRPSGTTVQVAGTTPLRLVVTNAFAEDVMRATSRGGRAGKGGGSSVSKNGLGSVNATGSALWVTRGGSSRRTEVLPGEVIPNVGDELGARDSSAVSGSNGRSTSTGDAADPTYLLVEILESDGIREFEREDDGAKAAQVPPPKEAFALALAGTFRSGDGLGASSLPAGATRGAALVDVANWRSRSTSMNSRLIRGRVEPSRSSPPPPPPLGVEVTLAPTHDPAVAAALVGSGVETFTARCVIDFPADEMLRRVGVSDESSNPDGWYPSENGEWRDMAPGRINGIDDVNGDGGERDKVRRIRVRARLAEGLDLRPPRRQVDTDDSRDGLGLAERDFPTAPLDPSVPTPSGAVSQHAGDDSSSASSARVSGSRIGGVLPAAGLRLVRVRQLRLVWWSRNSGAACEMSAWDPVCPPGCVPLGTAVVPSFNAPGEALVAYAPWLDRSGGGRLDADVSPSDWRSPVAPAVGFDRVYGDSGSRLKKNPRTGTVAVWRPNPPPGYVAIGHVITPNHAPPVPSSVACVRVDLAAPSAPAPAPLWTTAGAESKLGSVPVAVYRTGVCAGAGWIAVASRVAEDISRVPPPFEIRWDAGSGVRVEDEGESESGSGLDSSSVKISLSANGPWAPVGVRQLGASSAAAVGVGPNRGTALVVDRRRGCVRAPATLTSLLPFQLEARTVRLTATKLKTKTLPGKTLGKTLDGDAAVGSIVVEVFESERFFPFLGWQEPKGQLDEFFTARFSRTVSGKRSTSHFPDVSLPEGWRWDGAWNADLPSDGVCVDGSGWSYAVNWTREWPPSRGSEHRGLCATRRRRWRRTRVHVGSSSSAASDGSHSSTTSATAGANSHRWTGSIDGSAGGTDGADARSVPLPLGCGGSGSGGDESLGLDLRLMNGVWGTDVSEALGGDMWPVRVGSLGLKNKTCGFNAQGPWLASCVRGDADFVGTGDGKTKQRFVVVVAEPDAEVTSAGGGDVLGRDETAWKLTAHPPVSVQTALPCDCSYEIVDGLDESIVLAAGVARAGATERIVDVNPASSLRLRLVPLDPVTGAARGRCVGSVPLNGTRVGGRSGGSERSPAVHEMLLDISATFSSGSNSSGSEFVRLAVTCEPACVTHVRSGPAPILVDVRAPLLIANGCPFPLVCSGVGFGSNSNSKFNGSSVPPGRQAMVPTDPVISAANTNVSSEDLHARVVYVAREGDGRAPSRIDIAPGSVVRSAVSTAEGVVEVVASASAWAPPGVSSLASTSPCLRVTVVPSLAVVNLSGHRVAIEAAGGGIPRDLEPGAGPLCVFAPPRSISKNKGKKKKKKKGRPGAVDADSDSDAAWDVDVRLSARCDGSGHAWCPKMSIDTLASINGGLWVRLPRLDADDTEPANFVSMHVSVESAAGVTGGRLLVIRGGNEGTADVSGTSIRVANKTLDGGSSGSTTVWIRQVAKRGGGSHDPEGPWLEVKCGESSPWALANPLRVDDAEYASFAASSSLGNPGSINPGSFDSIGGPSLTRRLNIAEAMDGRFVTGEFHDAHDSDEDEDEDEEDDDDASYVDLGANDAARPAHAEVVLGPDPTDPRAPRCRIAIPADVAAGADGGGARCRRATPADGESAALVRDVVGRSDRFDRPCGYIRKASAVHGGAVKEISYAVRRRWDGVACVIEVSPHAVCEDDINNGHGHGTEAEMTASLSMRNEREYEQIDCGRIDEAVTEVSLPSVTVSLVDDGDERLLWSFDGIALRLGSRLGIDGKCASTELRVLATQIDDQHPRTAYPVLLYHNPARGALLDLVLTSAPPRDESDARHPGLCVNATPGGLHLRVYEPLVWRLKAFAGKLSGQTLGTVASGTNNASAAETDDTTGEEGRKAAVKDPSMALGLLRLSSLGVRLTFKPAPRSRPSTVGPAAASVLAFLNLDRLPVAVGAFVRHRVRLKRSDIARQVIGHVKGEAMSQCLAVLTSVNHLGNVAGTLDAFGDNIRRLGNLGMDDGSGKKKKGSGSIDDCDSDDDDAMGEDAEYPYVGAAGVGTGAASSRSGVAGVVEKNVITGAITGSSELAKNVLVDGVGGIFTKSIAGFQKSGISGLATGTARGIGGLVTGAAAGAVGAVARVVEGVDATVGAAQDQVKGGADAAAAMRRRLPLATRGDGVVRAWNEADARGLHLLRSASVRDALGNRRRPFASGRFEAALPLESDGRVLLLSHRHVGCVVSATEAIEWILPWNQVASIGVDADTCTVVVHARGAVGDDGGKGSDPFGAVLAIGSQGKGSAADVDRAKRFAKCGSVGRAEAVAGRVREAWAANRAQGGAAAAAGGGF